ncbi:MAG: hypothetical protein H3C47_16315 [Candidatus Cloacimonetes bacterium]|nr:hypothetical protein [Candidatus Cloacimonadota bacterium]
MNRTTCLLILWIVATVPIVFAQDPSEDLIHQSQRYCLQKIASEGNFALEEAILRHGNVDVKGQQAPDVFQGLIDGGYLPGRYYCYSLVSNLSWNPSEQKFLVSTEVLNHSVSSESVVIALQKKPTETVMIRGFVLEHATNLKDQAQNLLIESLFQDEDLLLLPQYFTWALKVWETPTRISLGESNMNVYAQMAISPEDKARLFFMTFWFTKTKPKTPSVQTMAALFDLEVPMPALQAMFGSYSSDLLAEFTVPFKEGYGPHHQTLLHLFSKQYSHPRILQALAFALINRGRGHFAPIQSEILHVWETMTGIKYLGSTHEFLAWYEEQKKLLKGKN